MLSPLDLKNFLAESMFSTEHQERIPLLLALREGTSVMQHLPWMETDHCVHLTQKTIGQTLPVMANDYFGIYTEC